MNERNLTKAQQETTVGEGLALGLLAIGVVAVTSGKQALESAIGRAWRAWPHSSRFPQVKLDITRNDISRIIGKSEGRVGSNLAYWSTEGRWYEPLLWNDWSVEESGEELTARSGISFADWVSLAESVVVEIEKFQGDTVRRREG